MHQSPMVNLYRVWLVATAEERDTGKDYYTTQRVKLYNIAVDKEINYKYVIGAFAALSPNNDEAGTYRDLRTCIDAHKRALKLDQFSTSTYGPNKAKAMLILMSQEPLNVLGGLKVTSFYRNLLNPTDPYPVTVDGHMVSCWHGKRLLLKRGSDIADSAVITSGEYYRIANDIRTLAKFVKLIPCQLQSTLWLTWKRIHNIRYTPINSAQWRLFE